MLATLALSFALAAPLSNGLELRFERSLAAAKERAQAEQRLVFAVLLAQDEGRSRELEAALGSKALAPWLDASVCVAGELGTGAESRRRKTLGGLDEDALRTVAAELREGLLRANEGGVVAAPQVAWLGPDGALLASVPYELDALELAWCFADCARRAGLRASAEPPDGARPPRRLLRGELYRLVDLDRNGRGFTPAELEEALEQRKRAPFGGDAVGAWLRILITAEKEAVDFAETELSRGLLGWLGGERQLQTIDYVGAASPADFWSAIAPSAKDASPELRLHTAAAFEQLGAPQALKTVKGALAKEDEARARHAWLRALGACGRDDKGARKELLGVVESKREKPLARYSALFALGHLAPSPETRALLSARLASEDLDERLAAACGIALSRDLTLEPALSAAFESAAEGRERDGLATALAVLRDANLAELEELVQTLTDDELPRPRLYFRAFPPPPADGERGR